jgi:hypothetical protein
MMRRKKKGMIIIKELSIINKIIIEWVDKFKMI